MFLQKTELEGKVQRGGVGNLYFTLSVFCKMVSCYLF